MKAKGKSQKAKIGGGVYASLLLPFFLLPFSFFLGSGCSGPAYLTFRSTQSDREFSQKFERCAYALGEDGQYDVILSDANDEPALQAATSASSGSGPLKSSPSVAGPDADSLRQVIHIRVLWKPLRGSKPDTPSATNAVIDWYVRDGSLAGNSQASRLHYRGAGFVTIVGGGSEQAKFIIRSAQLDLADGSGRLHDPLGTSSLIGSFVADKSPEIVASAVRELHGSSTGQADVRN